MTRATATRWIAVLALGGPGCFLLPAPDAEIAVTVDPGEVALEPADYRTAPTVAYFGIRNDGLFPVYAMPESFEVTTPGLDPATAERVRDLLRTRNDQEILIPAGDQLYLEVSYEADAATWVHGSFEAVLHVVVGGFNPALDSGSGAMYVRRLFHQDAWVERAIDLKVTFTLNCDLDEDGYYAHACSGDDCNDFNVATNPAGVEACDGSDNDCDGQLDEDGPTAALWFFDADADGFGVDDQQQRACYLPPGSWAAVGGDCDDLADKVYPRAVELCDGLDNDCNGAVDDSQLDGLWWYEDGDGDGFGKTDVTTKSCAAPPVGTWASTGGDCDDAAAAVHPGAPDTCEPEDRDCDGVGAERCESEFDTGEPDTGAGQPLGPDTGVLDSASPP